VVERERGKKIIICGVQGWLASHDLRYHGCEIVVSRLNLIKKPFRMTILTDTKLVGTAPPLAFPVVPDE
jgi:hypothetical protein